MANNGTSLGLMNRYMSSIFFTGLAIVFWGLVNVLDTVNPSPELDMVKVLAYIAIMFSGLTIIIDVIIIRYKRK